MDDVSFYDAQVRFHENLGKIQQERSKLEQEFFNLVRSDKKLMSARSSKLRRYWKQASEREKRARERNEALLRDFSDFELRLSQVHAETERLERQQKYYEAEVAKQNPKWSRELNLTKAKKQLEEGGFVLNDLEKAPSQNAASHTSIPKTTSSTTAMPLTSHFTPTSTPLFTLVPYNNVAGGFQSLATVQNSHPTQQPVASVTKHTEALSLKDKPVTTSSKYEVGDELNGGADITNVMDAARVPSLQLLDAARVPSLQLPSSSDPKIYSQADDFVNESDVSSPQKSEPSSNNVRPRSPPVTPTPMTPTHHIPPSPDAVQHVEITSTKPKTPASQQDDFLSELSDVSSVSNISKSSLPSNDDLPIPASGAVKSLPKSSLQSEPTAAKDADVPLSPDNVTSPKTVTTIKIPSHNIDSAPSESVTTETSHKTIPLTSSAVYRQMLRSNEMSSTFGMSHHFDDDEQDEIEEIVSPKTVTARSQQDEEDGDDHDSHTQSKPIVNPARANDANSDSVSSSKERAPVPSKFPYYGPARNKAPWDTDSEDDDDMISSLDVAKGNKLDDDDFDFYD